METKLMCRQALPNSSLPVSVCLMSHQERIEELQLCHFLLKKKKKSLSLIKNAGFGHLFFQGKKSTVRVNRRKIQWFENVEF